MSVIRESGVNAKVPFEKLMATSPLKEHQMKMIRQIPTKQQWSNRVQIKIIRLARTISDLEGSRTLRMNLFGKQSLYEGKNIVRKT